MEAEIERIGVLRNPVDLVARRRTASLRPSACAGELAPRRREARARSRAHGGGGPRRARRPRARQRPLPVQLLGHEGLRRGRLPAGGRADADLPRGLRRRRRLARPGRRTSASSAATTRRDPRPPQARALDARASRRRRATSASALELSLGTQASDRMVGEPTTYTRAWFDAWPGAADATPLLARARAIKTEQELERMRLANEIAAAAMEHVAPQLRPGHEGERGGGALERLRPRPRDGLGGQGRARAAASRSSGRARGSGRSRRPATGRCRSTSRRCSRSGSAPTATGATTRRTSARAS